MNRKQFTISRTSRIAALAAFTVLATACSVNVNRVEAGPIKTETFSVPATATGSPNDVWDVYLDIGAADVTTNANGEGVLQGTVEYNVDQFKPIVTTDGTRVEIRQGKTTFTGVPPLNMRNDWRLKFGQGVPIRLRVSTGATKGDWELGGVSLRELNWKQGAADTTVQFSQPNPESLDNFDITADASQMVLRGLAKANIRRGTIEAGAGDLQLHFDGKLTQNAEIDVRGGVSSIRIFSGGNPIQAITDSGLSSTDNQGWSQSGDTFYSPEWNSATGSTPKITLRVKLGVGSLKLRTGE